VGSEVDAATEICIPYRQAKDRPVGAATTGAAMRGEVWQQQRTSRCGSSSRLGAAERGQLHATVYVNGVIEQENTMHTSE